MDRRSCPRLLFVRSPSALEEQLDASCFASFQVDVVRSYSAACEQTKRQSYELILIDEGIMHARALELCNRLSRQPGPPILIQVRTPSQEVLDAAFAAGALDFIVAPANPDELRARARLAQVQQRTDMKVSQLIRRLTDLSMRDPLTQLYNRAGIMDQFKRRCLEYMHFHVLLLDLDRFKQVNDRYGHNAGDIVLREIGVLLRSILRSADIVGRWGGEELLVILPGVDKDRAMRVAEKVRMAIEQHPFRTASALLSITTSVGVAPIHKQRRKTAAPEQLLHKAIEKADQALYLAKDGGRNRIRYHS